MTLRVSSAAARIERLRRLRAPAALPPTEPADPAKIALALDSIFRAIKPAVAAIGDAPDLVSAIRAAMPERLASGLASAVVKGRVLLLRGHSAPWVSRAHAWLRAGGSSIVCPKAPGTTQVKAVCL